MVGIHGYDILTSASALENISNKKKDQDGVEEVRHLESRRVDERVGVGKRVLGI